MSLSAGSLHIDRAMTEVSVRYTNADFVGDEQSAGPSSRQAERQVFHLRAEDDISRGDDDDERAPGAEADESNWSVSWTCITVTAMRKRS